MQISILCNFKFAHQLQSTSGYQYQKKAKPNEFPSYPQSCTAVQTGRGEQDKLDRFSTFSHCVIISLHK